MLARPLSEPFDSDQHLFEPWWGGTRALISIGPGERPGEGDVRVVDADDIDRTATLPELAGTAVRVAARSAILDGELVVVDAHGRADTAALERRLDGKAGRPVAFLAFDLLHLDGRVAARPAARRRREALRRILRPGDEVVAVPAIATEGRALFDAIVAQGLAGMMARQRQGPYLAGRAEPAVAPDPGGRRHDPCGRARGCAGGRATSATAPVLAMLSRLPLDDEA